MHAFPFLMTSSSLSMCQHPLAFPSSRKAIVNEANKRYRSLRGLFSQVQVGGISFYILKDKNTLKECHKIIRALVCFVVTSLPPLSVPLVFTAGGGCKRVVGLTGRVGGGSEAVGRWGWRGWLHGRVAPSLRVPRVAWIVDVPLVPIGALLLPWTDDGYAWLRLSSDDTSCMTLRLDATVEDGDDDADEDDGASHNQPDPPAFQAAGFGAASITATAIFAIFFKDWVVRKTIGSCRPRHNTDRKK